VNLIYYKAMKYTAITEHSFTGGDTKYPNYYNTPFNLHCRRI